MSWEIWVSNLNVEVGSKLQAKLEWRLLVISLLNHNLPMINLLGVRPKFKPIEALTEKHNQISKGGKIKN